MPNKPEPAAEPRLSEPQVNFIEFARVWASVNGPPSMLPFKFAQDWVERVTTIANLAAASSTKQDSAKGSAEAAPPPLSEEPLSHKFKGTDNGWACTCGWIANNTDTYEYAVHGYAEHLEVALEAALASRTSSEPQDGWYCANCRRIVGVVNGGNPPTCFNCHHFVVWREAEVRASAPPPPGEQALISKLDEIEKEYCRCGAGLESNKPMTWEWCAIHDLLDDIRAMTIHRAASPGTAHQSKEGK